MLNRESVSEEWNKVLNYCRKYAYNSLSYLSLEPDKKWFFSQKVEGVASYQLSGRLMLVCGDPICAEECLPTFLQELTQWCSIHHYKLMLLFVLDKNISIYQQLGMNVDKIAEEAIFDMKTWTIAGGRCAKARSSWHTAVNYGLIVREYRPWIQRDESIESQMHEISAEWLKDKKTAKLQFAVGSLMLNYNCDKRYFYAIDKEGIIQGFNVINPYLGGKGWIIDVMRRRKGCPHGVMELLFHDIYETVKSEGAIEFSLGTAPFYNTLSEKSPSTFERAGKLVFEKLNHVYGFKPLQIAKAKYNPAWKPIYIVSSTKKISLSMVNSACDIIDSGGLKDYFLTLFNLKRKENENNECKIRKIALNSE